MARILIVDDSPTETHIYKTMLEKHGYEVITADSGEAGVRRAKNTYLTWF
jgi:twitching motility two-component system response regulator PilH